MKSASGHVSALIFGVLCVGLASCSSCDPPIEPIIPVDVTGTWTGGYTVYDGAGRPLTDSLLVTLEADGERVVGEGIRIRVIDGGPATENKVSVTGTVAVTVFRLEFGDPSSGHAALFSGKVVDDTLRGKLSVGGTPVGDLDLARASQVPEGTENAAESVASPD